jgi:CXXC-20-CXXC protein
MNLGVVTMQKCEKCHTKFKWVQIYKSVWRSGKNYHIINCRKCGTEHTITRESKIIRFVIFFLSIFTSLYLVEYHLVERFTIPSVLLFLIILPVISGIVFTISPLIFRYYSKYHSNYKYKF